ncbi:homoserine O-acetyltransferase/O-succinyltransferase family protein [Secundilactobacillus kimchicus]|uniref:homoserine O-acetyltransferase/O-succinyltransferase family protein n=1 Tax=Secundilactobacillus kimchicus TaxID=528209 RepID=UPI0024A8ED15|nr:homoserine O-succinyltransferase [Secundilactobacillus kimchicus]
MTVTLENGFLKQQLAAQSSATASAVKLVIVNLMPNKLETERQFVNLLAALSQDVRVTFARMATHQSRHTDEAALQAHYVTLDDIFYQDFDGLIVTGAPVETLAFAHVDYWAEFQAWLDWRDQHVDQTIFECWAAQAALFVDAGIEKRVTAQKVFGVYRSQVVANTPLTTGLATVSMPQSRHATLPEPDTSSITTLVEDGQAGPIVLSNPAKRSLYISGHPEYETETLINEFRRDQKKGQAIQLPKNYFAAACPVNTWRQDSVKLYNNWLSQVRTHTLANL